MLIFGFSSMSVVSAELDCSNTPIERPYPFCAEAGTSPAPALLQGGGKPIYTISSGRLFAQPPETSDQIGIRSYFETNWFGKDSSWPTKRIAYRISVADEGRHQAIHDALCWWQRTTPVTFELAPADMASSSVLQFVEPPKPSKKRKQPPKCATEGGAASWRNIIYARCLKEDHYHGVGSYAHEIGHALGLQHEHQRPDIDKYIDINKKATFTDQTSADSVDILEWLITRFLTTLSPGSFAYATKFSYDINSLMHYELKQYGETNGVPNAKPTKVAASAPPPADVDSIGQRKCISAGDAAAIQRKYENKPLVLPKN